MKKSIYKLIFNHESKRWDYLKPPLSKEAFEAQVDDPLFDPYDETVEFIERSSDEEAARTVNQRNRAIALGYCEIHACKDCGRIFFIDTKEKEWYIKKKYHLPKRCKSCRAIKKRED